MINCDPLPIYNGPAKIRIIPGKEKFSLFFPSSASFDTQKTPFSRSFSTGFRWFPLVWVFFDGISLRRSSTRRCSAQRSSIRRFSAMFSHHLPGRRLPAPPPMPGFYHHPLLMSQKIDLPVERFCPIFLFFSIYFSQ